MATIKELEKELAGTTDPEVRHQLQELIAQRTQNKRVYKETNRGTENSNYAFAGAVLFLLMLLGFLFLAKKLGGWILLP